MGIFRKLFGRGMSKEVLIKNLVRKRIQNDPIAKMLGDVDDLSTVELMGLPEATIVTIVETWAILNKRGFPEKEILEHIEAHRSSLGDFGDMPSPLTLLDYIKYRLELEHGYDAQIREDFIDYAVEVAKKAFL